MKTAVRGIEKRVDVLDYGNKPCPSCGNSGPGDGPRHEGEPPDDCLISAVRCDRCGRAYDVLIEITEEIVEAAA